MNILTCVNKNPLFILQSSCISNEFEVPATAQCKSNISFINSNDNIEAVYLSCNDEWFPHI